MADHAKRTASNPYRNAPFWDMMSARYARSPVADEAVYREKLRRTQALFTRDTRVLEFGCGTGSTALVHAPHVQEIVATDISEKMIAIATDKAAKAGIGNVRFVRASLADMANEGAAFDVVLGLNILHLMKNWRQEVIRSHEVLKPGGYFVTSTACLGDWARWARFISPVLRLSGRLPQVSVLSERELLDGLTATGFEIVDHWVPGKRKAVFTIARKPA